MALAALANGTTFAYLAVIAGAGVKGDVITATHLNSLRLGGARRTLAEQKRKKTEPQEQTADTGTQPSATADP